jgi:hypothetical protein
MGRRWTVVSSTWPRRDLPSRVAAIEIAVTVAGGRFGKVW